MTQSGARDEHVFVDLTDFHEVEEVLRRGKDFLLTGTKIESYEFNQGTLLSTDGRQHLNRRRGLMKMINADQPWGPEGSLVDEVFQANVRDLLQKTTSLQNGHVSFELVSFCSKVIWRVVAAMVGIDGIDDPARVDLFQSLALPVVEGLNIEHYPKEQHEEILIAARESRAKIRVEMFDPSVECRRQLIAAAKNDSGAVELPADLITSLLVASGDEEPDIEIIFREMITLLAGAVNNPVSQITWALDDVLPWLEAHPECTSQIGSKDFLNHAVKETIRLHRSSRPYITRIAAQDTVLESTKRVIPKGTWLACYIQAANHDATVFGRDADTYNPYRTVLDPKIHPFGVGLGAGPHVCLGRPLVLWDQGTEQAQGLLAKMLRFLLERGVHPDPDGIQEESGMEGGRRYLRYDVLMPVPQVTP